MSITSSMSSPRRGPRRTPAPPAAAEEIAEHLADQIAQIDSAGHPPIRRRGDALVAVAVVELALLRIAKDLVRLGHLVVMGNNVLVAGVLVGMVFFRKRRGTPC